MKFKTNGDSKYQKFKSSRGKLTKRQTLCVSLVVILYAVGFWCYWSSLSYPSMYQVVKNSFYVFLWVTVSVTSFWIGLRITFWIYFPLMWRIILILSFAFSIFLCYICDRKDGEGGVFGYGRYAFYGLIATIIGSNATYFVMYYSLVLMRKFKVRLRPVALVTGCVGCCVSLYFMYIYFARRRIFNHGLFGDYYDRSLSDCRQYDDVFLWSQFKPRFFVHMILGTYWCDKDQEFTSVVSHEDSEFSTVYLDSEKISKEVECTIELSPNLDYITFEEYMDRLEVHTNLQKFLFKKTVFEKIGKSREYTYDSEKYETILVNCGKGWRNIVVSPKPRVQRKDLKSVSIEHPNVITIWLDCITRKGFERDFPLSIQVLRRIISTNEKKRKSSDKIEFYQFYNHRVVGWNTLPQFRVMLTGYIKGNVSDPLWVEAKDNGFVTVYSADECNEACTRYNHRPERFDHEHLEPFCSSEYTDVVNHFSAYKGPIASSRRCLYQKEAPEYVFEYLKNMELVYPSKSKYILGMIGDAHEGTGESIGYVDRFFASYLEFLEDRDVFSKSIMFIFGDHGNHASVIHPVLGEKPMGKNPALYILAPEKFMDVGSRRKNIEVNRHRMVTGYDLHKTWSSLVGGRAERNGFGMDLFEREVPRDRTCASHEIHHSNCVWLVCKDENGNDKTFYPDGKYTH